MGALPTRAAHPLTHFSPEGGVRMVDVSHKPVSERVARAEAFVRMGSAAREALRADRLMKGDALTVAQIAGIAAAKQTGTLIPLAHPIPLSGTSVKFEWQGETLRIETEARTSAQTGVEMEALVAATIAALAIYDMTKSIERGITIERVALLEKRGGKSGVWRRE
jgi:cyclic pyranopterin monophosphate synthase